MASFSLFTMTKCALMESAGCPKTLSVSVIAHFIFRKSVCEKKGFEHMWTAAAGKDDVDQTDENSSFELRQLHLELLLNI